MKVGSLVRLKSGSPVMVVKGKITKDCVKCKWFNGGKMCKEDFHVDALTLVDKKGAPIDHDVIEKTVSLKVDVSEIDKSLFGDFMSVEVDALTLAKWRSNPAVWLEERFGEKPDMLYWDSLEKNRDHFKGEIINPFLKSWNIIASGDHENWCGLKADSKWPSSANRFIARVIFWFLDCYPYDSLCHAILPNEYLSMLLWEEIKKAYPAFKKIRPYSSLNDARKIIKLDVECNQKNSFELDSLVSLKEKKIAGLHQRNMLLIMGDAHELPDHTMKAIVGTSNGINNMILAVGDSGEEGNTLETFVKNYDKVKSVTVKLSDYQTSRYYNKQDAFENSFEQNTEIKAESLPLDTIVLSQKVVDTKKFTIMKMKEGDLVQFKSGSPTMLISEILDDVHCLCSWFNGSHYHTAEFQINHLKLTEGNAPKPKTQIKDEPSPSINWIKIDRGNLPPQDAWVLCSDGKEWKKAYVTNQFEFAVNPDSKLCYEGVTHFAHIELPK